MSQIDTHTEPVSRIVAGQYNGVDAPLSYGDSAAELAALRSGCGLFHLAWRGLVTAGGKDRVRWLHNMVTNNVRDLALNHGVYAFVLNHQGRILGDMTIYNLGESLLLETDRIQIDPLLTTMKRYIIMDKVDLADARDRFTAIGVCGPHSQDALAKAGFNVSSISFIRQERSRSARKPWSNGVCCMGFHNTDRTFAIVIYLRKPDRRRRFTSPKAAISGRKSSNASAHAARCIAGLSALILAIRW
jgi:folate-binding Fe-S cluster repair protein YgfZ